MVIKKRLGFNLRGLGLEHASEDVLRPNKLVVVKVVVLNSGTDEPEVSDGRFDDYDPLVIYENQKGQIILTETPAGVDGNLCVGGVFNIVVSCPQPCVLHV